VVKRLIAFELKRLTATAKSKYNSGRVLNSTLVAMTLTLKN